MNRILVVIVALCHPIVALAADETFVPKVSVQVNGNTASITAGTVVPNGCYSAAGAEVGLPRGQAGLPEAVPVQLKLKLAGGMCTQALKTVEHRLDKIKTAGKTSLMVYVVLGDEVKGKAAVALPASEPENKAAK